MCRERMHRTTQDFLRSEALTILTA
jgi:hypothetical protein